MKIIDINKEHISFVESQAPRLDIGGFSNLATNDLSKASRLEYQYTGLYGELAWYLYRYKDHKKLKELLDYKYENCRKNGIGDSGFDDSISSNDKTRFVDIKTSHVKSIEKIPYLNLVIPQREYHENMIYVCAFSIGENRKEVNKVAIAGWCINEDIKERWKYDTNKYCVKVNDLRPLIKIEKYF